MELTITFFIKFTLVVYFVLALFVNLISLLHLHDNINRYTILSFFLKGLHFNLLSFKYPSRRVAYKE